MKKTTEQDRQDPTVTQIREALESANESHEQAAKLMTDLKANKWSQRRIADAVGVSQTSVSRHLRWFKLDPRPPYGESHAEMAGKDESPETQTDATEPGLNASDIFRLLADGAETSPDDVDDSKDAGQITAKDIAKIEKTEREQHKKMKDAIKAAGLEGGWMKNDQWYKVGDYLPLFASCSDEALEEFLTDPEVSQLVKLADSIRGRYVAQAHLDAWKAA